MLCADNIQHLNKDVEVIEASMHSTHYNVLVACSRYKIGVDLMSIFIPNKKG